MQLEDQRLLLTEWLVPLGLPVSIRSLQDHSAYDDSCFYAENHERDFVVSLHEDVDWGPELATFIEPKDEWRAKDRLNVDVPNNLEPHLEAISVAFENWFRD